MKIGDTAPDFTLPDQNANDTTLSTLVKSSPVVLFFYPQAMTTGCTKESCHFRDLAAEFAAVPAQRVGISMDAAERQKEFADRNTLDFTLLSDTDGAVARLYGVKRALSLLKVKRSTFVIGADMKILDVISSEMNMNTHADQALATLTRR